MLRNQSCDYPFFICMPTLTQGMLLWHMCLWMSFQKKKNSFQKYVFMDVKSNDSQAIFIINRLS